MARTGKQYLEALRQNRPNLWYKGERVEDPTTHPVFKGITHTLARLYDMQHDPRYRDILTYEQDGKRYAMSLLPARTKEDLARRSAAYKLWADANLGMMGRCPDYLNAAAPSSSASSPITCGITSGTCARTTSRPPTVSPTRR